MRNNLERLDDILESIQHQYQALLEEYTKIKNEIKELEGKGIDVSYLVQALRDNLSSRKALYEKIRQTYKDALNVK